MKELDILRKKRSSLINQLDEVDKKIDDLIVVDNKSYVGKAYKEYTKYDPCHYYFIMKLDETKGSLNNPWFEYLYVNTSEEFACISKSVDSLDSIFEGSKDEISIEEFKKALDKAKENIYKIKI